jgi:hypothetical protein
MRSLRSLAFVLAGLVVLVTGAAPAAGAAGLVRVAGVGRVTVAGPTCNITDPENITGVSFVNNQFVNGTWNYATGVSCNLRVADIALFEQLNLNGTKVDSKLKNFTGVPHSSDAILSQHACAVCNGTWTFLWGQIIEAQSGVMFTSAPTGCVTLQNGLFLVCVETKTVTI